MKLIAIKRMRYANVPVDAGQEFEATDKDGKLLKLIGKAKDVIPVAVETPAKEGDSNEQDKPKRTYKRRDMKAEG